MEINYQRTVSGQCSSGTQLANCNQANRVKFMWFIGAISAFVITVIAHAVLRRIKMTTGNITVSFLIAACLPAVILFSWLVARFGCASQAWAGLLVFCFLCQLYVFLITFAMASVTANCLVRLSQNQDPETKIDSLYESANMVDVRIDRLKAINLINETPSGLIRLTTLGEKAVHIFARMRNFFYHRPIASNAGDRSYF